MNTGKFIIILILIISGFTVTTAESITITVGGNIEDMATKVDHITSDLCRYVYNCTGYSMVSLSGKSGQMQQGYFYDFNVKAIYTPRANTADYARYTEKAVWAETGKDENTAYSRAFTANMIFNRLATNSHHSEKALGGDYAPGAEQSVVVLHEAIAPIRELYKIDFYSYSDRAGGATVTSDTLNYTGSYIFKNANNAESWDIQVPAKY